jgi:hypothetical protein
MSEAGNPAVRASRTGRSNSTVEASLASSSKQVARPGRHPHGHHAVTCVDRRCSGGVRRVWTALGRAGGVLGRAGGQRAPQPPSSTRSDPVIESLPGEHRYTAAAAISAGSISRFTGEDARITLLSTSSSDKPCATA